VTRRAILPHGGTEVTEKKLDPSDAGAFELVNQPVDVEVDEKATSVHFSVPSVPLWLAPSVGGDE
jgi:hypothetical protein